MKTVSRVFYIIAIITGIILLISYVSGGIVALVNPKALTNVPESVNRLTLSISFFILAFFCFLGLLNCFAAMRRRNIFNNVLSIIFGVLSTNVVLLLAGIFGCLGCRR